MESIAYCTNKTVMIEGTSKNIILTKEQKDIILKMADITSKIYKLNINVGRTNSCDWIRMAFSVLSMPPGTGKTMIILGFIDTYINDLLKNYPTRFIKKLSNLNIDESSVTPIENYESKVDPSNFLQWPIINCTKYKGHLGIIYDPITWNLCEIAKIIIFVPKLLIKQWANEIASYFGMKFFRNHIFPCLNINDYNYIQSQMSNNKFMIILSSFSFVNKFNPNKFFFVFKDELLHLNKKIVFNEHRNMEPKSYYTWAIVNNSYNYEKYGDFIISPYNALQNINLELKRFFDNSDIIIKYNIFKLPQYWRHYIEYSKDEMNYTNDIVRNYYINRINEYQNKIKLTQVNFQSATNGVFKNFLEGVLKTEKTMMTRLENELNHIYEGKNECIICYCKIESRYYIFECCHKSICLGCLQKINIEKCPHCQQSMTLKRFLDYMRGDNTFNWKLYKLINDVPGNEKILIVYGNNAFKPDYLQKIIESNMNIGSKTKNIYSSIMQFREENNRFCTIDKSIMDLGFDFSFVNYMIILDEICPVSIVPIIGKCYRYPRSEIMHVYFLYEKTLDIDFEEIDRSLSIFNNENYY